MKTDLAPKYLYYYILIVSLLVMISVSVIHLVVMNNAIKTGDFTPFFITSVFGTIGLIIPVLIINKFRYLVINPTDERKFISGNLLMNSHQNIEDLEVVKKVWINTFKIKIEGRAYFITSFDQSVEEFNYWKKKY